MQAVQHARKIHPAAYVLLIVAGVLLLSNCGLGSSASGGISGDYLSIAPTPGSIPVGASVTFTSTAHGAATNLPLWSLSNATLTSPGTLSNGSGAMITYTAPASPPIYPGLTSGVVQGAVTLNATSAGTTRPYFGSVFFYITAPSITAGISPTQANVPLGKTAQFQGYGVGGTNPSVTWQVNGMPGGSVATGTISAIGLYTAPPAFPVTGITISVTAVSVADPTKSATAPVTLF